MISDGDAAKNPTTSFRVACILELMDASAAYPACPACPACLICPPVATIETKDDRVEERENARELAAFSRRERELAMVSRRAWTCACHADESEERIAFEDI